MATDSPNQPVFTPYQKFIIAILAILQFTIILDFMVLAPLGAQLLLELHITPAQFSHVVSAYAFSAGASGLLAAGFADKFDRKKLLLFFYSGFIAGTIMCGIAPDYKALLIARIVTGIFGGVVGSISFAMITDLFALETRGRVMGFIQMSFAGSQILGLPIGLYLATKIDWHAPFILIVIFAVLVGVVIIFRMKPVDAHLKIKSDKNAFQHLMRIISQWRYIKVFAATIFLATGGFMLMPFGTVFLTRNLGIGLEKIPLIYLVTGICSMVISPLVGKLSDQIGKYKVFVMGSILTILIVAWYCNLTRTPLPTIMILNVILFAGISARMVSASALVTAIPDPGDRGGFMGINSSIQQVSGGIAAFAAGEIVWTNSAGLMENYDMLGYVVCCTVMLTIIMMYFINKAVARKIAESKTQGATVW
jgi:predicted MFS family arabinose efflux permease